MKIIIQDLTDVVASITEAHIEMMIGDKDYYKLMNMDKANQLKYLLFNGEFIVDEYKVDSCRQCGDIIVE